MKKLSTEGGFDTEYKGAIIDFEKPFCLPLRDKTIFYSSCPNSAKAGRGEQKVVFLQLQNDREKVVEVGGMGLLSEVLSLTVYNSLKDWLGCGNLAINSLRM